jgi:iron(III) transport system ATP-binding protein
MATVKLDQVRRAFGDHVVVNDFTATIAPGEFVAFLGPSGCGKTTTLRMIAGLDQATGGEISIGERLVSAPGQGIFVPPEARHLGMVFQSYALWPHMTVAENVAYPLRLRGCTRAQALEQANEILEVVHLPGMAARQPHQLSGGQQQRVALARALVMEPEVLLLDEPLSNLDATLREQMRFEIKEIQARLKITMIFVTHDQAEAFAMSDRIMVMRKGRIVQMGTPAELYRRPADSFVAGFLGLANILECQVAAAGQVRLKDLDPAVTVSLPVEAAPGTTLDIAVRPEAMELRSPGAGGIPAQVTRVTFLGDRIDYALKWARGQLRVTSLPPASFPMGAAVEIHIREAAPLPR